MEDYLAQLNEQQRKAVTCGGGPVLVIAGAGSGKTRVLTSRAAFLMESGAAPTEIMALTFTNKAASEMRARLEALLGFDIYNLWVGTFHRICLRILRLEGEKLGIPRDFTIYDEIDQRALVRSILKRKGLDQDDLSPNTVLAVIGEAKNQLLDATAYAETALTSREEVIAEIFVEYEAQMAANGALDFDDLLNRTVELFNLFRDTLKEYRARFPYILVDEYQDTNEAQYRLLKLLAGKNGNLFVVGDPDQSIYAFRGARLENILNFQRDYPTAQVFPLEINYRSTQQILQVANKLIVNNASRLEKELRAHEKEGEEVTLTVLADERGEARFIADTVERLHVRKDCPYRDMAIFYRTHAQSRALEDVLMQRGLPYKVFGGLKFYERAEIKDTIAYLRVLANPDDNVSLLRIINVPRRGIGNVTIERLEDKSTAENRSLWRVLRDSLADGSWKAAAGKALRTFRGIIEELTAYAAGHTLTDSVQMIWQLTGYREQLLASGNVEDLARLENLDEFLTITKHFDEESLKLGEVRTITDFLANVALSSDLDQFADDDYLTLMTLHMAKGLEFPVVFIMGLEENIFPHVRSIMSGRDSEIEEERRLCYVGITRAMDELYLLRTFRRTLWGKTMNNRGSRFLDEMALSTIKESRPAATTLVEPQPYDDSLQLGDKVLHAKYGQGVVVSLDLQSGKAKVAFPALGVKEFLLAYANLEKVAK